MASEIALAIAHNYSPTKPGLAKAIDASIRDAVKAEREACADIVRAEAMKYQFQSCDRFGLLKNIVATIAAREELRVKNELCDALTDERSADQAWEIVGRIQNAEKAYREWKAKQEGGR